MTPDEIYKAILQSITQVCAVRLERGRAEEGPHYTTVDRALLDEMARNSAQVIVGMLELRDSEAWHRGVSESIDKLWAAHASGVELTTEKIFELLSILLKHPRVRASAMNTARLHHLTMACMLDEPRRKKR